MWARIENDAVAEITDIDPAGRFHSSLEWISFNDRSNVQPGWRWDGETLSPPPVDASNVRRAGAIDWIDSTADHVRASDRSIGKYLDAEYQLVAQALAEYRANPEAEVPESIQSYAAAEGLIVEKAAQQIAEAAARAEDLLQAVRRIRLAGKASIRDAGDDADFMEIAQSYVARLELMLPKT